MKRYSLFITLILINIHSSFSQQKVNLVEIDVAQILHICPTINYAMMERKDEDSKWTSRTISVGYQIRGSKSIGQVPMLSGEYGLSNLNWFWEQNGIVGKYEYLKQFNKKEEEALLLFYGAGFSAKYLWANNATIKGERYSNVIPFETFDQRSYGIEPYAAMALKNFGNRRFIDFGFGLMAAMRYRTRDNIKTIHQPIESFRPFTINPGVMIQLRIGLLPRKYKWLMPSDD